MERSGHPRSAITAGLAAALVALLLLAAVLSSRSGVWPLVRNTLALSLGTAIIATPVGAILSFLLVRWGAAGRSYALAAIVMLLFIPLQLQLAGWDALFGKLGWQTLAYGSPAHPFLHGLQGAIWLHAMAAIPWTTLLGCLGWIAREPQWEEAALLEMPPWEVTCRVILPGAAPFLLMAALWAGIQSAGEMTVTNIYVVRTFAEELYNELAADGLGAGLITSLLPGVLGTAAVLLAAIVLINRVFAATPVIGRRLPAVRGGAWQRGIASAVVWAVLLALVAVPIASLLVRAGMTVQQTPAGPVRVWSAKAMTRVISTTPGQFADEFHWTLLISLTAATFATLIPLYPAWQARKRRGILPWSLLIAALATPGPVIGLAVIWLLNRPLFGLDYLYDYTIAAPVLAMLVRAAPLAFLILTSGFVTLGRQRLEAAALDGAAPVSRFWRIAVAERLLVVAVAWLAAFAQTAGDLSTSILVLPPGMTTLQFRLFEKVHSGVEEQVAGIALVSGAMYAVLTLLAIGLWQTWSTSHRSPLKPGEAG